MDNNPPLKKGMESRRAARISRRKERQRFNQSVREARAQIEEVKRLRDQVRDKEYQINALQDQICSKDVRISNLERRLENALLNVRLLENELGREK